MSGGMEFFFHVSPMERVGLMSFASCLKREEGIFAVLFQAQVTR